MSFLLKIKETDNVAVAIGVIEKGKRLEVSGKSIDVLQDIPQAHKIAICDIKSGENIIKYGNAIGHAKKDIKAGEHVHSHNIATNLEKIVEYTFNPTECSYQIESTRTFMGYLRKDGKVGIRNEVWIIPTVGCVNGTAKMIEKMSSEIDGIDGVYAFTHPFGCSQLGEDHENTQKILAGLVNHPNAGGVLVLGLGCENNQISKFREVVGESDDERVKYLECQSVEDEISKGLELIKQIADIAKRHKRQKMPISELIVGLKCGGSDGYSGITANPMVGEFSDMLVRQGGTSILTEVPEMFGAEQQLMDRCSNLETYNKVTEMINDFKQYYISHNQVIYENPSPGNKEGGITTLEEKSLGCITKSGSLAVENAYGYGQMIDRKGLVLLSSPGNDLVASTALVASGAHMVLFTTGRGTPFGSPAPTVKISTNTELYRKKRNWIDFNAGEIVQGKEIKECADELMDYVIGIASGSIYTINEQQNIRDISIFKDGVFL